MKIKQYNSDIWGKTLILVDEEGMPLHFPNRYTFSTIEKRGGSNSSVEKALYVIARLYLWAGIKKLCVQRTLYYGDFLSPDETSDLVDFLQYTSETQN